jgi:hypothetical protein
MTLPRSVAQNPETSILDVNWKQCYLGNQYQATTGIISLATTSEVPFLYLSCPAGLKSLFQMIKRYGINDVTGATGIIYRVYFNPTGVSGGTVITPINHRLGSSNTSIATVLLQPTVTGKGTATSTASIGWENQVTSDSMVIVDPGYSILVTAQATAATQGFCNILWYEI